MLSPRAEAFLVHNLLRQDCYQDENKRRPVQLAQFIETPYDDFKKWNHLYHPTVGQQSPVSGPHPPQEQWCSSYSLNQVSQCRHPSVVTDIDQQHVQPVTVELSQGDLWQAFHSLGTEMIITKSGRRMFPPIRVHISGLEADSLYKVSLEFAQCGVNKYRYVYHSSKWTVAGVRNAEGGQCSPPDRIYVHPDSPLPGHILLSRNVSFEKVKLTNSPRAKTGQVSLSSMQKFQPKIHLEKLGETDGKVASPAESMTFVFPQTSFIAVTAYQNNQITRLKIETNPFAKGFREDNCYKNFVSIPKASTYLPGLPLWSPITHCHSILQDSSTIWNHPRVSVDQTEHSGAKPKAGTRLAPPPPTLPPPPPPPPHNTDLDTGTQSSSSRSWIHPAYRESSISPPPAFSWMISRRSPHHLTPLAHRKDSRRSSCRGPKVSRKAAKVTGRAVPPDPDVCKESFPS